MNGRPESDEWLMGQVGRGQRESLEKLVRRYASPLLTFLFRMTGNRHSSEELLQEVFLRVWSKRGLYRLDKPFRAWLFAIAANLCRSEHRRPAVRAGNLDEQSAPGRGETPEQRAIAHETSKIVETAVADLPPQQRMVVVLRVWNGLNFSEIADIAGIAESTARSNMTRGLESLRKALSPQIQGARAP